ncbi:MAG: hypothetical protein L0215_20125, partial [Gemmataceae bacterium]|nr:hypothetical protein [Gemmataceae bacterium]
MLPSWIKALARGSNWFWAALIFWSPFAAIGNAQHRKNLPAPPPFQTTGVYLPRVFGFLDRPVSDVGFTPDSKYLITATPGKKIKFWSLNTGQLQFGSPNPPLSGYDTISLSPDGRHVVTRGLQQHKQSGYLEIIDTSNGKIFAVLRGHQNQISKPVFSPKTGA